MALLELFDLLYQIQHVVLDFLNQLQYTKNNSDETDASVIKVANKKLIKFHSHHIVVTQ